MNKGIATTLTVLASMATIISLYPAFWSMFHTNEEQDKTVVQEYTAKEPRYDLDIVDVSKHIEFRPHKFLAFLQWGGTYYLIYDVKFYNNGTNYRSECSVVQHKSSSDLNYLYLTLMPIGAKYKSINDSFTFKSEKDSTFEISFYQDLGIEIVELPKNVEVRLECYQPNVLKTGWHTVDWSDLKWPRQ